MRNIAHRRRPAANAGRMRGQINPDAIYLGPQCFENHDTWSFTQIRGVIRVLRDFMMSLRRIAYVLKVFPKLSETFVAEELAEVRRRGIEVRIISLSQARSGLRHAIVSEAGLDSITCYPPKDFLAELKEFRPQLLHAHFATEATEAAIELATELELPFTFTAHGYDIHRKAPADFSARAGAAAAVV